MDSVADIESAIKSGDLAAARKCLDEPGVSSAPTSMGVSPLLMAVYLNQIEIAKEIAARRPIDLLEASALGDVHRAEELIRLDPKSVETKGADGFTPLATAAFFNHPHVAEALLKAGADPNVASSNAMGVAPIHAALAGNHLAVVDLLIRNGADIAKPSAEGWTPLHYAADRGDVETAKRLLALAAISLPNKAGKTPAALAREKGHADLAALLSE